jgi:hypothetical protein
MIGRLGLREIDHSLLFLDRFMDDWSSVEILNGSL